MIRIGLVAIAFSIIIGCRQKPLDTRGNIVMNEPGWPLMFELNQGESQVLKIKNRSWRFRLDTIVYQFQPDFRNKPTEIYYQAFAHVSINGNSHNIMMKPYQLPQQKEGLKVLLEMTKEWANFGNTDTLGRMTRDARFAVVLEEDSWGPAELRFPIQNYRWRSSAYQNTWFSLVPTSKTVYFHKGDDFGAIPDTFEVIAPFKGKVTTSPYPHGDGKSNSLIIENDLGFKVRFGHMNIEYILPQVQEGLEVVPGSELGRTGSTWNGRRSQYADPHLHTAIYYKNMRLNTYAYWTEAYLRDYPEPVLPQAGGYYFTIPGRPLELDGSGTIVKDNGKSASPSWLLTNGEKINAWKVQEAYQKPGFYAEEFIVKTDNGRIFKDIAQVRVFDPDSLSQVGFSGWIHHFPVRDIKPGDQVVFWLRDWLGKPMVVNFGDTQKWEHFAEETSHVYTEEGVYTVTAVPTDTTSATIKTIVYVGQPDL